jgi:hypothetical protein
MLVGEVVSEYTATSGLIASKFKVMRKDGLAKHWEEESKRPHIVKNENRNVGLTKQKAG